MDLRLRDSIDLPVRRAVSHKQQRRSFRQITEVVFFKAHPQLFAFVQKMNGLAESVKKEWDTERRRPKRLDPRSSRSFENVKNLVDNFYNDGALSPPL